MYRLWCGLIATLYLALLIYSILVVCRVATPATGLMDELVTPKQGPEREKLLEEKREGYYLVLPIAVVGLPFYCFAAFIPRKKWSRDLGTIAIIGSLFPFCATWVGVVPLLICWLKPATKQYFSSPR
jgi:hypothetical protein